MKKMILSLIAAMLTCLAMTVSAGTITFGDLGLENGVQYLDPFDGGDFTVTFSGGGNNGKYYTTGAGIRVYGGGKMTIAAKEGNITSIKLEYDGTNKPTTDDIVDVGTYISGSDLWTGNNEQVVFTRPTTGSGHWRVKSIEVTIGGEVIDPSQLAKTLYSEAFSTQQNQGKFTIDNKFMHDSLSHVWTFNSYGAEASAYVNNTCYDSESWLVSPVIDLTNATEVSLEFRHAVNKFTSIDDAKTKCVVMVKVNYGNWVALEGVNYPDWLGWSFVDNKIDLSAVADGKKLQVAFKYTSDDESAGTWEVHGFAIKGKGRATIMEVEGLTETVTIDDIRYVLDVNTNEATVTSNSPKYSGSITIPSTVAYNSKTYRVTSIGYDAFGWCTGLTSITIPNSVTTIDESAFYGCTGLTTITIPNSVTSIGYNAFANCTGLASITVQNGNPQYDSRDNCNAIIATATNTLISGCKNTSIPNSVTAIGTSAFTGCTGLTSITIPNSVTSIGYQAFWGCTNLSYIRSEIEVPFEIGENVFEYNPSGTYETINATLYVPAGTKPAYEATPGWNQLNIEEAILYPSNICSHEDEQVELPITLDNVEYGENVAGVSFTLQLPEGVSVALDEDGDPVWSFVDERVNKKQFSVLPAQYDDGTWGFRVYTTSVTGVIKGTEGAFMTITLNVADGVADGDYTILLKSNKLSVKDAGNNVSSVVVANVPSTLTIENYKQGDVNGDGEIDLSDAIMVTYYSLHIEPSGFIHKVADMNSDGEIDLSDAIIIIFKSLGVLQTRGLQTMGDALCSDDYLQMTAGANSYSVSLTNEGRYLGMQCDIRLPEGMTLENVTLNRSRAEDHTVMWNEIGEECYRVVAFPMNGTPFFGNMGELFSFEVSGSQYGQVSMENIFFVGTDLQKYHFDALASQLTGVAKVNSERQGTGNDVYDLQGRKVTKRQKGLYLQGNKKYLVK